MKLDLFTQVIPEHFDDFYHPGQFTMPKTHFPNERHFPPGYTTPYIGYLLNFATSLQTPEEAHLQLGTNCQRTLAYAMTNQLEKKHYLLADYRESPQELRSLKIWLNRLGYLSEIHLINGDYSEMLTANPAEIRHPVGVCFYDVQPDYDLQMRTFRSLRHHLANEAVIVIDDANWGVVRNATQDWIAETPGAELLFDLPTPINGYSTWWNGVQIVGYRRDTGKV